MDAAMLASHDQCHDKSGPSAKSGHKYIRTNDNNLKYV